MPTHYKNNFQIAKADTAHCILDLYAVQSPGP